MSTSAHRFASAFICAYKSDVGGRLDVGLQPRRSLSIQPMFFVEGSRLRCCGTRCAGFGLGSVNARCISSASQEGSCTASGAAPMAMHSAVLMLAKVTLSPAPGTMGRPLNATSGAPAE